MAKFSKDDYSAIAGALNEHIDDVRSEGVKDDASVVKLGALIALRNRVIQVRDTPAKPRGKAAQNGAAVATAAPAKAGAKK